MKQPLIIAYDITNPKRLSKALKILKGWRLDGQKSVHECILTKEQVQKIKSQLTQIMHSEEDKLLIVWLDNSRPIETLGTNQGLKEFKNYFHIQ